MRSASPLVAYQAGHRPSIRGRTSIYLLHVVGDDQPKPADDI
jgi:hypothetical protein